MGDTVNAMMAASRGGHKPKRTTTSTGTFPCPFCDHVSASKRRLNEHLEHEHDTKQKLKCHICLKMFTSKLGLQLHLNKHYGKQAFHCSVCNKGFAQKYQYDGHMNVHVGAKPFQCAKCFKCFAYSNHLSKHKHTCPGVVSF